MLLSLFNAPRNSPEYYAQYEEKFNFYEGRNVWLPPLRRNQSSFVLNGAGRVVWFHVSAVLLGPSVQSALKKLVFKRKAATRTPINLNLTGINEKGRLSRVAL
jgi:hypothetical protein